MDGTDMRNQSVPELISLLTEQMSRLVRAELALARAELFANARQTVVGGGMLAAAAVMGLTAWLAIVATIIAGIAHGIPVWASLLVVGVVFGGLAGLLALRGRARLARGMPPLPLTADTVRKDLHDLTRPGHNGDAPVPAQRDALNAPAPHKPAPNEPAPHKLVRRGEAQ